MNVYEFTDAETGSIAAGVTAILVVITAALVLTVIVVVLYFKRRQKTLPITSKVSCSPSMLLRPLATCTTGQYHRYWKTPPVTKVYSLSPEHLL